MVRFADELRYRYVLEACERAPPDQGAMNPHDVVAVCDPVLLEGSLSDVEGAIREHLDMDMRFFERTRQQLVFMTRVWDAVIDEKYHFDAEGTIGADERRIMEACLLCLRVIPNRVVGTGPGLTSPPLFADAHAIESSANREVRQADIEPPDCRCISPTVSPGGRDDPARSADCYTALQTTPSEERELDDLVSSDEYGSDGSSVPGKDGMPISMNARTTNMRVEPAGLEIGRTSQARAGLAQKRKYSEMSGNDVHHEGPPRKKVTWPTWRFSANRPQ